jgi:hypothetical protein
MTCRQPLRLETNMFDFASENRRRPTPASLAIVRLSSRAEAVNVRP